MVPVCPGVRLYVHRRGGIPGEVCWFCYNYNCLCKAAEKPMAYMDLHTSLLFSNRPGNSVMCISTGKNLALSANTEIPYKRFFCGNIFECNGKLT